MKSAPDVAALTDMIYGALHGEGSWQEFLDAVRRLAPNGQAMLFYHDAAAGAGAFPLSAGADGAAAEAYGRYYSRVNPWMPHAAIRPLGRVVQADDMLPRTNLLTTEFYNDYLAPQDLQTGFGVTIERDGDVNFLFSILCADVDPRDARAIVACLQALVPHLRHAFRSYRRHPGSGGGIPAPANGVAVSTADAVVRLGPGAKVLFAGAEALRLAERCAALSIRPFGRLACRASALAEHIERLLAAWDGRARPPAARTFHLLRTDGGLPLRVTAFCPGGGSGPAFFRGPECILVFEDPADGLDATVEEFGDLHGLTGAERRLVAALAAGFTTEEVAAQAGVSLNTLKTQLRHIFAKTGLNRQADIVRHVCLMAGARSAAVVAAAAAAAANGDGRPEPRRPPRP